MERMLVVVFDNEAKAFEGKSALRDLDLDGSVTLYAYALLVKNSNGTLSVKQRDDDIPVRTLVGASLGTLIGVLGGPAGMAVGAAAGFTAGGAADLYHIGIGEDFLDEVSRALTPGKVALVAQVDEDWITPVDERMQAIGGAVIRRSLSAVERTIHDEEVNSMKADLAQMKAEHAKAHADRKAKLMAKINELDAKIQAQLQRANDKRVAAEHREQEKVRLLQAKAASARAKAS